ncbi:hypothetical protein [Streptomyces sp. NPDC059909]|uniref:hypothetical protein n=1 Tax=Streptomyces sp. NPDC059909 TaxID=3346998 RepID=UPI00365A6101
MPDDTPTDRSQTPEIALGAGRTDALANGRLAEGTGGFGYPSALAPGEFALTGTWSVGQEALTSRRNAGIKLNFSAGDVYLNVGGSGTVTATLDGKTTTHAVSGPPNIYRVVSGSAPRQGVLTLTLSPGLSAYSFTFG